MPETVTAADTLDEQVDAAPKPLQQTAVPGALAPFVMGIFPALFKVLLEHAPDLLGKPAVLHELVGIQVPAKIPSVKVAGTNRYPVVTERRLGMQEAAAILEYPHAVTKQAAVETSSGMACRGVIGVSPRQ